MRNRTKHVVFAHTRKCSKWNMDWLQTKGVLFVGVATTANGHPTVICMCSLEPAACENTKALLATTNIPLYNPFLPFFFLYSNISATHHYIPTPFTLSAPPRLTLHIFVVPVIAVFFFFFLSSIQFIHRLPVSHPGSLGTYIAAANVIGVVRKMSNGPRL